MALALYNNSHTKKTPTRTVNLHESVKRAAPPEPSLQRLCFLPSLEMGKLKLREGKWQSWDLNLVGACKAMPIITPHTAAPFYSPRTRVL